MLLRRVLLLSICGLLVVHALHFFRPVDDAYISFRYAENLAAGQGVVFNAGERVEGYTNFLWVVVLSLCRLAGAPVPLASQILGVLLSIGSILLAADLARRIIPSGRGVGIPAALLLVASPAVAMWAGGGMEVPLFSFLAMLTAWCWIRESEKPGLAWRWPVASFFTSLARPDGVLLFAVTFLYTLRESRAVEEGRVRRALQPLAIFLALGTPYFVWRWLYYGALLPNTYYAKIAYDPSVLIHGLYYLEWFLIDSGGAAILLGSVLALRSRDQRVGLLLCQGFWYTAYIFLLGGDGYAYSRFLVPVMVLLAPVAEVGYCRAWQFALGRALPSFARGVGVPTLFLLAACSAGAVGSFAGADHDNYVLGVESEERRRVIGEWLRRNVPPGAMVALNPVGMIPYVSKLPTLDLLGITDAHIARKGERITNRFLFAHNRFDPNYVLSRRPDYLFLGQATTLDVDPALTDLRRPGPSTFDAIAPAVVRDFYGFPGDARIWEMPVFRRNYLPTVAAVGGSHFYFFALDPRVGGLEARVQSNGGSAGDHAELARILAAKGAGEEAVSEARVAERLDPAFAREREEIEKAVAEVRQQSESGEAALEALQRYLADRSRGDLGAAEQDLLSGLRAAPAHPILLFNLGGLYERTSRSDQAIDAYRRALETRPDFADACNNLGTLYAQRGDMESARRYWERAVSIDPQNAARENLRILHEQVQNGRP